MRFRSPAAFSVHREPSRPSLAAIAASARYSRTMNALVSGPSTDLSGSIAVSRSESNPDCSAEWVTASPFGPVYSRSRYSMNRTTRG